MRTSALVIASLLATSAAHADDWTDTDRALEVASLALAGASYLQVRPQPMAGTDAPREAVYLTAAIVHYFTAHLLPPDARNVFQCLTIGVEVRSITQSWSAGYAVTF